MTKGKANSELVNKAALERITDLVVSLKEKQGTERQEVQKMIKGLLAEEYRRGQIDGYKAGAKHEPMIVDGVTYLHGCPKNIVKAELKKE